MTKKNENGKVYKCQYCGAEYSSELEKAMHQAACDRAPKDD